MEGSAMKKIFSMVLCLALLLCCALPVLAEGVLQEVMEATKSVVRIMSRYSNGYSTVN